MCIEHVHEQVMEAQKYIYTVDVTEGIDSLVLPIYVFLINVMCFLENLPLLSLRG